MTARIERFPTAQPFVIARGAKNHVDVLTVTIAKRGAEKGAIGRGEGTPIYYLGDTAARALEQARAIIPAIEQGADRLALLRLLPAGAARNAIDAALWDLEAKEAGKRVWELAGLPPPGALATAFTISLGSPAAMAAAARKAPTGDLLKLKLGGAGDIERVAAVRAAVPEKRLIADANESWRPEDVARNCDALAALGVELIEQPLPPREDAFLSGVNSPVPLAADESLQTADDLDRLADCFQAVNIKLDKCGGLTAALKLAERARGKGLLQMTGCMLATSLGVAPAFVLASLGRFADLDGPLLLARDRPHGFALRDGLLAPPEVALWG